MMASPLAKGLFHRAIVQSGSYGFTPIERGRAAASEGGHKHSSTELLVLLHKTDGSAKTEDDARAQVAALSRNETREYLYSKTAEDFFALFDGGGFGMIDLPRYFGDGSVLPASSDIETFSSAANHNQVPTILGTNRDEPAIFMVRDPYWVRNWLGFIPRLRDESAYLRAVHYGAQSWKARGVDELARAMRASGNPNVYTYRFDWDELPSLLGYDLSVALGAAHGLEIAFAFGEFERGMNLGYLYEASENKDELARAMMGYWAEFARSGDPGQGGADFPRWNAFDPNGESHILLDLPVSEIRMDTAQLTMRDVKAQLAADTAIASREERCGLYATNFRFEHFDQQEYDAFGDGGCADLPAQQFQRF